MRTEEEMMQIILSFAKENENVKVVGMEGSRTNNSARKDEFQDYDITYIVTDMEPFTKKEEWLDIFGKRIFMQKPEAMSLYYPQLGNWFSYLMLFEDGNRIDLTIVPLDELELYLSSDSLLQVLLDKDDLVEEKPVPTTDFYLIDRPTPQKFDDSCNEFWWISTYVVKGISRGDHVYAADYLNQIMRKELLRMKAWKVGFNTDFSVSIGRNYKKLEQYVSKEFWERFYTTYNLETPEKMWEALFTFQELFREVSKEVAKELRMNYQDYDENISKYTEEMYAKHGKSSAILK